MAVSISVSITENSQNVAKNTSNVTVKVTAKWTGGSYNAVVDAKGTPQAKGWVKIDGTTYNFASTFNTGQSTTGSQVVCTKTVDVSHASDGTKTLSCSASYTTGVSSGTVTAFGSKVLTQIARKSTLSASNGTLGNAHVLTISREDDSFTHTITYKCGTATGTVTTKTTYTTVQWTPPVSLAKQNKTGKTVSITFTITTYSGSTNVGDNTKTVTMTIPTTTVKPSCSITVSDPTGVKAEVGDYIQGLSKFKIVVTPTLAQESPIASYKTEVLGSAHTGSSFTTGYISDFGTLTVKATVTDKRGAVGSKTVYINVLEYSPPNITTLNVQRCNSDGTQNDKGDHAKVTWDISVSDLSGINQLESEDLYYKKSTSSAFTRASVTTDGSYIFPAETGSSYDIKLTVSDHWKYTTRTTSVSTAFTILHVPKDGTGLSIGKVTEKSNLFDIGIPTRFEGGILQPVLDAGTDLNTVMTPNVYRGGVITNYKYANAPYGFSGASFTLIVDSAGEGTQLRQELIACNKTNPLRWERFYYGYAWGDWLRKQPAIDSGWIYPTLDSAFVAYNSESHTTTKYRKIGKMVEVRGTVKPASDIAYSTEFETIFTLPSGYRPSSTIHIICQGSGNCTWLLRIAGDGTVGFARYRNGDTNTTATTNVWLPFQATFFID